jgi:hypothetical protein
MVRSPDADASVVTSQGDLLRVVERIKEMVLNQYTRYQKDIGSACQNIKFRHEPAALLVQVPCSISPPLSVDGAVAPAVHPHRRLSLTRLPS